MIGRTVTDLPHAWHGPSPAPTPNQCFRHISTGVFSFLMNIPMIRLTIFFISAFYFFIPAVAAITVDKTVLTFSKRANTTTFPAYRSQYPLKTVIHVGGSPGAWTVAVGGAFAPGSCAGSDCITVDGEHSGTPISSGTGNTTLAYDWIPNGGEPNLAVGTYHGTVTFTETGTGLTAVTNITLIEGDVNDVSSTGEVKYTANGPSTSCTTMTFPANTYTYAGVCPGVNIAPSSNLPDFNRPVIGGSYTDTLFGGVLHRITDAGCVTEYGTVTPFSSQSTYIFTSCGIYNNFTGALVRSSGVYPSGVQVITVLMSPTDDHVLYYYTGAQIRKWDFVAGLSTTLVGDFSGAPYSVTLITAGGTADIGEQGWFSFYDDLGGSTFPNVRVFAVNIPQLETDGVIGPGNTYVTTLSGPLSPGYSTLTRIDWTGASDVDDVTGKHYIFVSSVPISLVLSVGGSNYGLGTITTEYVIPEWPDCSANVNNGDNIIQASECNLYADVWTHNSMFKNWDGQIVIFSSLEDSQFNQDSVTFTRLSAGTLAFRPREDGGGSVFSGKLFQDMQPGCSSRVHFCGMGNNPKGNFFYSLPSGNPVVSGSTVVINLAAAPAPPGTAPAWPTSGTVQVIAANATNSPHAWSCLNGLWTATVSNAGATVTLAGAGTACSGVSGTINPEFLIGDATVDAPTYFSAPYQDLNVAFMWKMGKQVHKVAQHRGRSWDNRVIGMPGSVAGPFLQYQTQLKCGLSRNGDYQACNIDWGGLDYIVGTNAPTGVYSIKTSIGPSTINGVALQPAETNALLSYSVSTGSSCSIEVSAASNFQTILRTITDAAGPISRQTALGTLTAATNYWWRLQCGLEVEASVYPFTTVASGTPATRTINTGIGAPTITGATKVVLEHQTDVTTGAWTAVASVPCATGGSGCTVSWAADIGHVNWQRFRFQNVSSVDLVVTAPTAINASR